VFRPMRDAEQLRAMLGRMDGRGYKAYKDLEGSWRLSDFVLHVDHVQGDPFAEPTRVRAVIEDRIVGLDGDAYRTLPRALGTAAFLARAFAEEAPARSCRRGSGRSGEIRMEHPGQVVLPQTAVRVTSTGEVEARFTVGLPAEGRRIAGRQATRLLLDDVPKLVHSTLVAEAHDVDDVERHAATNEDATALRAALTDRGLLAFVADGAVLPRRSGVDDRPLDAASAIAFRAPDSMRVEVDLPNAGRVTGMGIPEGVTLIVGGGFHGKSTLLRGLEAGVYNHRPTDGRELVVSRPDTVKIRAEDGRAVTGVDISPFIDGLPLGRDTHAFSTANASGSTSQAAAIIEAIEAGASVLLVDEDTSATNFMIRDRRMQELVRKDGEPITPFLDRVRTLHERHGVNSVLVIGGSGDYLDAADRVIRMTDYGPVDVSAEAAAVAARLPTGRALEGDATFELPAPRTVDRRSLDPSKGRRSTNVKVPDERTLVFGTETIDLVAVEQLANRGQTRAIGWALAWVATSMPDDARTLPAILDAVERLLEQDGLDAFDRRRPGDFTWFRRFELAAALNRLRVLRVD
jgi:predicted ABC-class ATPase